jgi:hypothetical protein
MSVNGKPSEVKEGDVYLEEDGFMRMYFKNTTGVWFETVFTPVSGVSWVDSPRVTPYCPASSKFIMNVRDLLHTVKKEIQDESSS